MVLGALILIITTKKQKVMEATGCSDEVGKMVENTDASVL
jgi:hypothetical protein